MKKVLALLILTVSITVCSNQKEVVETTQKQETNTTVIEININDIEELRAIDKNSSIAERAHYT